MAGCTVRRMTIDNAQGRRTGRAVLIATAITAVLAGGGALAYVIGWGIADDQQAAAATPSGPPVALQMECTSIRRGYMAWRDDAMNLGTLDDFRDVDPGAVTPNLVEAGNALLEAVSGYPDQPSKELAVVVATYNVEVTMLNIEVSATSTYKRESFKKANAARLKVNDAYNAFWAQTCALSGVS